MHRKRYIEDMIGFAAKVLRYTKNLDQEAFVKSEPYYDATLRNLELGKQPPTFPKRLESITQKYPGDKLLQPVTALFMAI